MGFFRSSNIEELIKSFGNKNSMIREKAAEALKNITSEKFGENHYKWK